MQRLRAQKADKAHIFPNSGAAETGKSGWPFHQGQVSRGFGDWKASNRIHNHNVAEALRLPATEALLCDKATRRYAQGDGFTPGSKVSRDLTRKSFSL